jgi:hypothetical protein
MTEGGTIDDDNGHSSETRPSVVENTEQQRAIGVSELTEAIANSAIDRLQQAVRGIKPEAMPAIAATILAGTLAAAEIYGVTSAIQHLVPPGGSFLDGIREFGSVSAYAWSHLDTISNANEKLQVATAITAPYMAGIYTFLTAAAGFAATKDQKRK